MQAAESEGHPGRRSPCARPALSKLFPALPDSEFAGALGTTRRGGERGPPYPNPAKLADLLG